MFFSSLLVFFQYFLHGNHQVYGHIRRIYTVLANPTYLSRLVADTCLLPPLLARAHTHTHTHTHTHSCALNTLHTHVHTHSLPQNQAYTLASPSPQPSQASGQQLLVDEVPAEWEALWAEVCVTLCDFVWPCVTLCDLVWYQHCHGRLLRARFFCTHICLIGLTLHCHAILMYNLTHPFAFPRAVAMYSCLPKDLCIRDHYSQYIITREQCYAMHSKPVYAAWASISEFRASTYTLS